MVAIHKASRLMTQNALDQLAMQERIFHIKLLNRPIARCSQVEDCTYRGQLGHW